MPRRNRPAPTPLLERIMARQASFAAKKKTKSELTKARHNPDDVVAIEKAEANYATATMVDDVVRAVYYGR